MKVIIVEGLDNTGKTTYIKNLKEYLIRKDNITEDDIKVVHFKPIIGRDHKESAELTDEYNRIAIDSFINCKLKGMYKYIILDRSWISEYVYGIIYRERNSEDMKKVIESLNMYLVLNIGYNNVYLYYFNVKDPNFVIGNEDGNSLSIGNDQYNMIKREQKLFKEIYDFCRLHKGSVLVDVIEQEHNEYDFMSFDEVHRKLNQHI